MRVEIGHPVMDMHYYYGKWAHTYGRYIEPTLVIHTHLIILSPGVAQDSSDSSSILGLAIGLPLSAVLIATAVALYIFYKRYYKMHPNKENVELAEPPKERLVKMLTNIQIGDRLGGGSFGTLGISYMFVLTSLFR